MCKRCVNQRPGSLQAAAARKLVRKLAWHQQVGQVGLSGGIGVPRLQWEPLADVHRARGVECGDRLRVVGGAGGEGGRGGHQFTSSVSVDKARPPLNPPTRTHTTMREHLTSIDAPLHRKDAQHSANSKWSLIWRVRRSLRMRCG